MNMALATRDLQLRVAQASRAGRKDENEDALGIRVPAGHLLAGKGVAAVVADGVSGAGAGRRAAEVSVQGFLSDYYATPDTWTVKTAGERVLSAINRWLHGQGQQYTQSHRGFFTTLSALVLRDQSAHLFHVGDSRIQRLRDGRLEALTRDHAARVDVEKSWLTRAMGMDWQVEIDYRAVELQAGDIFLLSTDGLHGFLDRSALQGLLPEAAADPQACCEALLDAALAAGSDDNLSCQVLVIDAVPPPGAEDSRLQAAALPLPPELAPGMSIDGLYVEAELHATARSQLYRVHDALSGRTLVLKTPSRRFEDDDETRQRFALEDWVGQRIDHANVVKGVAPPRGRSWLYLLQESLAGETLAEWHRKNPKPPVQAVVALAAQAVKGLRALHRRETLHQDIKPENLLLCRDGTLKLIDLGAVHVAGLGAIAPGERPGAAEYAAPEYALGLPRDVRADQFSLAVTVYELLTGHHPYGDAYVRASRPADFQRLRYDSACRHNPHVPLWLDASLRKALALNPDRRYPALGDFLTDLQRPGPALATGGQRPWLERDPAGFWRALATAASLLALAELIWIMHLH